MAESLPDRLGDRRVQCPATEVLRKFSIGGLPEPDRESVEQHIQGCETCLSALETLDQTGDELVASLGRSADGEPIPDLAHPGLIKEATSRGTTGQQPAGGGSGVYADTADTGDDRFLFLKRHQEGGLGIVSVALDRDLNREVALKEMKPGHAGDRRSRERFMLEAEITGRLEHPGIIPVYGRGADARGRPFYAMRFVRGETLKEAIDRFHGVGPDGAGDKMRSAIALEAARSLRLRELLGRFVDVCETVAYAHSRDVLHRDLKPTNILLGPYGETLVVDWGLAKVLDQLGNHDPLHETIGGQGESSPIETTVGPAMGTPQ
jgi:tRNA A-37 threonylcarbamoyl transferase component Bud32